MTNFALIPNNHPDQNYSIVITFPEFAIKSPLGDNLEKAFLTIEYTPDLHIAENFSLTEFLNSFAKIEAYQEDITVSLGQKLVDTLKPKALKLNAKWQVCSKIQTEVRFNYGL